jgi:5'-nucleotidase
MKSKNELHVGQKLVIPALSQKEKALVGSGLFEKTTDAAKTTAAADSKKAEDSKSTADTKQAADAKNTTDTKTSADTKTSSDTKTAQADKKAPEPKQAQQPAPKETKLREYVVRENDTLWKIAARTLGDGNRFKEIADLNRNINPDNLVVGTKIKLPAK